MARGGKRVGAGRKAGSVTKKNREIAAQALKSGVTPLDVMLDNMRFYHHGADAALAKLLGGVSPAAIAEQAGQGKVAGDDSPVTVIDAMKLILNFRGLAGEAAKDAAPFLHARIAPVNTDDDRNEDEVPLADRLKAYAREDAIEASPDKVVQMKARKRK